LVREYQVAAIPGEAFGLNQGCHLRIAFGALRQDTVAQGMDRLIDGLGEILSS
jgi:aspartate/methionine/tyrosine aminotransferase